MAKKAMEATVARESRCAWGCINARRWGVAVIRTTEDPNQEKEAYTHRSRAERENPLSENSVLVHAIHVSILYLSTGTTEVK